MKSDCIHGIRIMTKLFTTRAVVGSRAAVSSEGKWVGQATRRRAAAKAKSCCHRGHHDPRRPFAGQGSSRLGQRSDGRALDALWIGVDAALRRARLAGSDGGGRGAAKSRKPRAGAMPMRACRERAVALEPSLLKNPIGPQGAREPATEKGKRPRKHKPPHAAAGPTTTLRAETR